MFLAFISIFLFNIPFGYWRANVNKFSFQWVLAVHIPVPFVIAYRLLVGFGFELYTYPVFVGAFFLGQLLGGYIFKYRKQRDTSPLSSCLFMDIARQVK